jgi:5-methylcytosine-specific restriction endonuclease McrA
MSATVHNRRTDIDAEAVAVEYRNGATLAELAQCYETTQATIRLRLNEAGQPVRGRAVPGPRNGRWAGDRVSDNTGRQRAARVLSDLPPCEACGATEKLHRHHRDGDTSNNTPSNLASLCATCHTKEHRASERAEGRGIYWAWRMRERWIAEHAAGKSLAAIARQHGVNVKTVTRQVRGTR